AAGGENETVAGARPVEAHRVAVVERQSLEGAAVEANAVEIVHSFGQVAAERESLAVGRKGGGRIAEDSGRRVGERSALARLERGELDSEVGSLVSPREGEPGAVGGPGQAAVIPISTRSERLFRSAQRRHRAYLTVAGRGPGKRELLPAGRPGGPPILGSRLASEAQRSFGVDELNVEAVVVAAPPVPNERDARAVGRDGGISLVAGKARQRPDSDRTDANRGSMPIDPEAGRRDEPGAREDEEEGRAGPLRPSVWLRGRPLRLREICRRFDRLRSSDQPITCLANCFDDSGARGVVVENSSKLANRSSEHVLGD